MKKLICIIGMALCVGCSGALDGKAETDTTTMPVDTNLNKTDVDHINQSSGTIHESESGYTDTTNKGRPRPGSGNGQTIGGQPRPKQ